MLFLFNVLNLQRKQMKYAFDLNICFTRIV